jgi:hypothetical protein
LGGIGRRFGAKKPLSSLEIYTHPDAKYKRKAMNKSEMPEGSQAIVTVLENSIRSAVGEQGA